MLWWPIIWTVLSIHHLNLSCIHGLSDDLQHIVHAAQSKRKKDNTVCLHSVGTNYCLVLNLNFQTAIMKVPLIKQTASHCFKSLQTIAKFLSLHSFLSPSRIHSPSLTIPFSRSASLSASSVNVSMKVDSSFIFISFSLRFKRRESRQLNPELWHCSALAWLGSNGSLQHSPWPITHSVGG